MKQQQEYDISIEEMVSAGIFETEEKAINEAIKSLLKENPEIKKRVAIYMYDNEEISLERAAEIAGVCYEDMKLILVENGIKLRLGPIDQEDAKQEVLNTREILRNECNIKQHRHL